MSQKSGEKEEKLSPKQAAIMMSACIPVMLGWFYALIWSLHHVDMTPYRVSSCGMGKGCFTRMLWKSPDLLRHGNIEDIILCSCLWFVPVLIVMAWVIALRSKYKKNIPPSDPPPNH